MTYTYALPHFIRSDDSVKTHFVLWHMGNYQYQIEMRSRTKADAVSRINFHDDTIEHVTEYFEELVKSTKRIGY
jgi:hypothetical protein